MDNQTLQLKIISPNRDIYKGPVTSISSSNSSGKFDILPQHANFVTLIQDQPIIIRPPGKTPPLIFRFPVAIIYTHQNLVTIYTDIQIELNIDSPLHPNPDQIGANP